MRASPAKASPRPARAKAKPERTESRPAIACLTIAQAAAVLSRFAEREISETSVRQDLEDGAPRNTDGTINLIHYAAWMDRGLVNGGD